MILNNKKIEFIATMRFSETFKKDASSEIIKITEISLKKKAVDMLVFEGKENKITVRCAGYTLDNPDAEKLDETTILYDGENTIGEFKFWLKIDDFGKKYIGTFLFPDEY